MNKKMLFIVTSFFFLNAAEQTERERVFEYLKEVGVVYNCTDEEVSAFVAEMDEKERGWGTKDVRLFILKGPAVVATMIKVFGHEKAMQLIKDSPQALYAYYLIHAATQKAKAQNDQEKKAE